MTSNRNNMDIYGFFDPKNIGKVYFWWFGKYEKIQAGEGGHLGNGCFSARFPKNPESRWSLFLGASF